MTKRKNGIKLSTILLLIAGVLFCVITPRVNQGYSMMVMNVALIYAIASMACPSCWVWAVSSPLPLSHSWAWELISQLICVRAGRGLWSTLAALLLSIVVSASWPTFWGWSYSD